MGPLNTNSALGSGKDNYIYFKSPITYSYLCSYRNYRNYGCTPSSAPMQCQCVWCKKAMTEVSLATHERCALVPPQH